MPTRTLPVQYSTLEANALGGLMAALYALPPPIACHYFKRGNNDVYRLTSADRRFIIRVYRHGYRSRAEVETELALMIHARAREICAVEPIPDQNGCLVQTVNAPEGQRFVALFAYASGRSYDQPSPAQARICGRELARLHRATADFPHADALRRYDAAAFIQKPLMEIERFALRHGLGQTHVDYFHGLARRLAAILDETRFAGLPVGPLHGDVFPANVVFTADDSPTLLDFDICGLGPLAYDVGIWPGHVRNLRNFDQEATAAINTSFLSGYEELRPLDDAERAFLPYAHLLRRLWVNGHSCALYDDWSNFFMDSAYFDREIARLRAWEKETNVF